ncbi:uncharacterized protein LOC110811330 isoform X2 [Carica papaya]|uniref:uncharacterized protein LOC110811330 isoform X2 n=1 Tax=Carica papaya TaxID=3649 RepID=UPI000B8CCB9A|nr:uncharacterized protein LOC110811330 isoform X2 [Carica papaya]
MSFCPSLSSSQSVSLFSKSKPLNGDNRATTVSLKSCVRASADVPDFLSANWLETRRKRPFGPRLNFAGFDPFERSTYFGPFFDLGQFERFRRIFHHSTYRVLLGHKDRKILSSLFVKEDRFKQRVWIQGNRPEEEETFEFTMVQRVGGLWDGYWLTESLLHDGDAFAGGLAY